jgi:hypothetical protein
LLSKNEKSNAQKKQRRGLQSKKAEREAKQKAEQEQKTEEENIRLSVERDRRIKDEENTLEQFQDMLNTAVFDAERAQTSAEQAKSNHSKIQLEAENIKKELEKINLETLEQVLVQADHKVSLLNTDMDELEEEIDTLRGNSINNELEAMNQDYKLNRLTEEIKNKKNDQSQLNATDDIEQLDRLQNEVVLLTSQVEEAEIESEKTNKIIQAIKQTIELKENRRNDLESILNDAKKKANDARNDYYTSDQRASEIKQDFIEMNEKAKKIEQDIISKEEEVIKTENILEEAFDNVQNQTVKLNQLKQEEEEKRG